MPKIVCALGRILYGLKRRKMPDRIGRILFIKTGALGDILMTTPLVRAIRLRFPGAVIDYACGRSYSGALSGNRRINYLIEFDEKIFFRKDAEELRKLAAKIRENRYDLIFVLDKHWAAGVFASRCGGFRLGFDRNGEGFANNLNVYYRQNKHDIDSYLDLAVYLRARPAGKNMELEVGGAAKKFAEKAAKKGTVIIAPGGGANTGQRAAIKLWPKNRYLELVDKITKKYRVIIVGGKEDAPIAKWLIKNARNRKKIRNFCGRTTPAQTAALCGLAKFVVCNDSGAMHIASCATNQIISLFGPTNPHVLAPLNSGSTFMWKETSACYDIYGKFGKCGKNLMRKISVEDVINAAKKYA